METRSIAIGLIAVVAAFGVAFGAGKATSKTPTADAGVSAEVIDVAAPAAIKGVEVGGAMPALKSAAKKAKKKATAKKKSSSSTPTASKPSTSNSAASKPSTPAPTKSTPSAPAPSAPKPAAPKPAAPKPAAPKPQPAPVTGGPGEVPPRAVRRSGLECEELHCATGLTGR